MASSSNTGAEKNDRDARLAAALRANLQRRKAQARGREDDNADKDGDKEGDSAPKTDATATTAML